MDAFRKLDDVGNWEEFLLNIATNDIVIRHKLDVNRHDQGIKLTLIKDNIASVSINVSQSFSVSAVHYNTAVPIRDLLGFAAKLNSWSQLEAIVCRVMAYPLLVKIECEAIAQHLQLTHTLKDSTIHQDSVRTNFLCDQLRLHGLPLESRRYTITTIIQSIRLYLMGSTSYAEIRKLLCLPHPNTLKKNLGSVKTVGGKRDCENIVNSYFSIISESQRKNCLLIFDEIYIKPSLRYRGGHLLGRAEDVENQCARTILAVMVKPLLGASPFVARLIPIYSLSAIFLRNELDSVSSIIEAAGGNVIGMICDNHFVNQQFYKFLSTESVFLGKLPSQFNDTVLLYDSVHLLKNIRNNWITESHQEIMFHDPDDPSHSQKVAKWTDIIRIQQKEEKNTVRVTQLTRQSCFPSPIERQKVSLVTNIFNDKTVAELRRNECHDTATFVSLVLRMWKMLNCKSQTQHKNLNDQDRSPFYSMDDSRISFLEGMVKMFTSMQCNKGLSRNRTLTTDTRAALVQTLKGFLHLINMLLVSGQWKYILLGDFQSDDLEGEFGVFRQMSGGCYYISVEQVLCSARLRRMKFLADIEYSDLIPLDHQSSCCSNDMSEEEWTLLDDCVETIDSISEEELCALYHISGYISYKEDIKRDPEEIHQASSLFTEHLSRGDLYHPPEWLFCFSQAAYCVYENFSHQCLRRLMKILETLFFNHFNDFYPNPTALCRRLANCFFKGEVRKMVDLSGPQQLQIDRKLRKLTN